MCSICKQIWNVIILNKHLLNPESWNIFRVAGPLWGNPPVTGGFPSQRPVTRSFDIFFDPRLNKRLGKQSRRRWFETPSRSLWRHCNVRTQYVPQHIEAWTQWSTFHYNDVIMTTIASQITSLTVVYSIVYSDADQIKHQSSASLAFVWGIHRRPVNSPHKWPVTRRMFSFDDVIMTDGKLMYFDLNLSKAISRV